MNLNKMQIRGESNGTAMVGDKSLTLTANGDTDWFHHPGGAFRRNNVLSLATEVNEETFSIAAKVSVKFAAAYDAGAIFVQADEDNWAKVAFEYSAEADDCKRRYAHDIGRLRWSQLLWGSCLASRLLRRGHDRISFFERWQILAFSALVLYSRSSQPSDKSWFWRSVADGARLRGAL